MKIEFGIHTIEIDSPTGARLSGRMFSGVLHLGTRFVVACRIEHKSPDQVPIREPVGALSLTVKQITCYGKNVEALDEGLTGCIKVEGDGLHIISPEMSMVGEE